MDSEGKTNEESASNERDKLALLKQKVEEAASQLNASGSSALTISDLENLHKELEQLLQTSAKAQVPSEAALWIHDELDKLFVAEKVGHSCDLCQGDLASDPERPNASLRTLQEACVLSCGHVYHFKCLKGTTLDLDNHSGDPSCIFCFSAFT